MNRIGTNPLVGSSVLTLELGTQLNGDAPPSSGGLSSTLQDISDNVRLGRDILDGVDDVLTIFDNGAPGAGQISGALGDIATIAYFGAQLTRIIQDPRTAARAALTTLGARLGAEAGRAIGTAIAGPIGGAIGSIIGSTIGRFLGSTIGKIFGKKKPKPPQASASIAVDVSNGVSSIGATQSNNSGNLDYVSELAEAAADTVTGLTRVLVGLHPAGTVINAAPLNMTFGHTGQDIWARGTGLAQSNYDNPEEAVSAAALSAIERLQVAGGNLYAKRALAHGMHDSVSGLLENFATAVDYQRYQANRILINSIIIDAPDSVEAASWIITLQRAAELGLNKSAVSDFYGGAKGFVDSLQGIVDRPLDYENILFGIDGVNLDVVFDENHDGQASQSEDRLFRVEGFLNPEGHADGGVGYLYRHSDSEMSTMNDIIFVEDSAGNASIDDLKTRTFTGGGYFEYVEGYGNIWIEEYSYQADVEGGDDIIIGNVHDNTLIGRSGADWLDGRDGNDYLYGGTGTDVLLGRAGNDFLYAEQGDDIIYMGSGQDHAFGREGDDIAFGGDGYDVFYGDMENGVTPVDEGDDIFVMDQDGNWDATNNIHKIEHFYGGGGTDIISFRNFDQGVGIVLNGAASQTYTVAGEDIVLQDVEGIEGSAFDDALYGDDRDNTILGGAGDDTINAKGGDNIVEGGAGADLIQRGKNSDGSWGNVTLSYRGSSAGVDVSVRAGSMGGSHAFGGDASGDVFQGWMNNVIGSAHADVLEGHHEKNELDGGDGDDYIIATRGADIYRGGEGFDTVDFGNHDGTSGLTIRAYEGGSTIGYLNGIHGAKGAVTMSGIEHIVGTSNADVIDFRNAVSADNVLEGGAGNDMLYGGAGNDIYFVEIGGGNDTIVEYGNQGHDTIMVGYTSGLSWDDIWIGAGEDLTVRHHNDVLANALNSPNGNRELVGVDALDIGGVGAVDVWHLNFGPSSRVQKSDGSGFNVHGDHSNGDEANNLLQGSSGSDTIYAEGGISSWGQGDNFLHGMRGNDAIYSSIGDDQYIFDRGSGADTVNDMGGQDHIQFGPGVRTDEVIFEVVGNDLYIGITPSGAEDTSVLNASQMADRIRIVGGAVRMDNTIHANLLEYITVDNVNIDLRTLDIDWVDQYSGGGSNTGGSNSQVPPLVFDLDGDGLELVSINESRIVARGAGNMLTRIGWLGADDGFLALDRDGDGKIGSLSEISFAQDLAGAQTDLEGLKAYDTNDDGVFDAQDARWGDFRIWQDLNQNGHGAGTELRTLAEVGVVSISLTGQSTGNDPNDYGDSVVLNTTDVVYQDGTTATAYDVFLAATTIQDGHESAVASVNAGQNILDHQLGRISARRIDHIVGSQQKPVDSGMEGVSLDAATRFETILMTSAWGRIVGDRSPLLASIYDAEAQLSRETARGYDLGVSQDELLEQFDTSLVDGGTDLGGADLTDDGRGHEPAITDFDMHFAKDDIIPIAEVLDVAGASTLQVRDDWHGRVRVVTASSGLRELLYVAPQEAVEPLPNAQSLELSHDLDVFRQALSSFGGRQSGDGMKLHDGQDSQMRTEMLARNARHSEWKTATIAL